MNARSAKYEVGDRLHFTPSACRAPHGTAIDECDVTVTEVVDHGSPTPHSPRFTYVVRALNGSGTQGTDDRELTEITIPAVTDAQRKDSFLAASMTVGQVSLELDMVGARGLTPERLDELADLLRAAAGHLRIANGQG